MVRKLKSKVEASVDETKEAEAKATKKVATENQQKISKVAPKLPPVKKIRKTQGK